MTINLGYFRWAICLLAITFSSIAYAQQPSTNAVPAPTTSAPSTDATSSQPNPSADSLHEIIQLLHDEQYDTALVKVNAAIKLYPKLGGFYALRGSIYSERNLFPQAEQDFQTALQLDPGNIVVKFNLVELKLMQKEFDPARAGFIELEKDPDMADLAAYKVFLCDLFAGHEDVAKKELDTFNDAGTKPSYYFSNAAWSLYHKNIEDGRSWLVSASNIYTPIKNEYYASTLRNFGYLPLPQPVMK